MPTYLKSVTATAGFLEGCEVSFKEGLNCIIGPPGTCKSVLVESIRFAFNSDRERVKVLEGEDEKAVAEMLKIRPEWAVFASKIKGTLDSGTICCEVYDRSNYEPFTIERQRGGEPRLYRSGVKEHQDTAPLRIEIYSQGDLQRIADSPGEALGLIDRPHSAKIVPLQDKRRNVADQLKVLGSQIRELRQRIADLRHQTQQLPELRARLSQSLDVRPSVSNHLDEENEAHHRRRRALQTVESACAARDEAFELLLESEAPVERMRSALALLDSLPMEATAATRLELERTLDFLRAQIEAALSFARPKLDDAFNALKGRCNELDAPYFALREQEHAANEWYKGHNHLDQKIQTLQNLEGELTTLQSQLDALTQQRAGLRISLQTCADEVYELRACEVLEINRRHAELVMLTLKAGGNGLAYHMATERLLRGSRLREQDVIAREMAEALQPSEVIDLVETGDAAGLAQMLDRDIAQMTRLMSYLLDAPLLYDLEAQLFEDELHIAMFDDGIAKPINELSKGQKASALLPLILRPAPYPLIFDQPEDDLDNRFISQKLVPAVRELKAERQIIFITHNANIPVIGEAENVAVMRMKSPVQAGTPLQGSVDEQQRSIIDLLEGGEQAFSDRQRMYSGLVRAPEEELETMGNQSAKVN